VSIQDGVIYSTHFPCSVCAKMLINAELTELVYKEGYPDKLAAELITESNIKVRHMRGQCGQESSSP